jgi:hypothetical protein
MRGRFHPCRGWNRGESLHQTCTWMEMRKWTSRDWGEVEFELTLWDSLGGHDLHLLHQEGTRLERVICSWERTRGKFLELTLVRGNNGVKLHLL